MFGREKMEESIRCLENRMASLEDQFYRKRESEKKIRGVLGDIKPMCVAVGEEENAIDVHKELKSLKQNHDYISNIVLHDLVRRDAIITCESCGCCVSAEQAVKGDSEIRFKEERDDLFGKVEQKEYIHTPYYCKFCAPEEE